MYFLNPDELNFPDPMWYHPPQGLIAAGGDLSPERLWLAYSHGIFPWYNPDEEILWWCPDPRFVLFPGDVKISKSMRKIFRDEVFIFTENQCFEQVMRSCAEAPRSGQDGTWISEELIDSFKILHDIGIAKSFEAWRDGELVGGFYGLAIGKVFCGESMFSKESNASKAVFLNFVAKQREFEIIDCQIHSQHLESLGAGMISKQAFLSYLPAYGSA